jgi:hypothetical protein
VLQNRSAVIAAGMLDVAAGFVICRWWRRLKWRWSRRGHGTAWLQHGPDAASQSTGDAATWSLTHADRVDLRWSQCVLHK